MPIMMKASGSVIGPVIICDICKKRIRDAKNGNVLFDSEDITEGSQIAFVHKGDCDRAFESKYGKEPMLLGTKPMLLGWEELSHFLCYLLENVKYDPKKTPYIAFRPKASPL